MIGDRIIGRGSTDSKGNLLSHIKAVEAFVKGGAGVPLNVKFIFDGEEEIGSPSLPGFVEKHRGLLAAVGGLSFDGGFGASGRPRIQLGSSGLLYVELTARGPKRDLHSGRARLVENPAWKLVWALSSMKSANERILIDGFYDDILPPTQEELDLLRDSGWDDRAHLEEFGVERFLLGVTGMAASERLLFQPTCNISGFKSQRLFELWRLWDREVRSINSDSCVIPNTGGGATSTLDMKSIGQLAPTLMADRQARRGLSPPWINGKNGKEYRSTMGRKPIVGIFSVGVEEPYRWKDSVQSEAEIRLWVADGVANGLRPWFTKFSAVLHDQRWLKPVEDLYRRYARWERYLRNEAALARVGLVYSQQTGWFYGGRVEDHLNGWYQALIEARIPFEMVHDRLLDAARLNPFKTLILPNIAALSESQCQQLRDFVNRGGGLIATYESSLYDEWGVKRRRRDLVLSISGQANHAQHAILRKTQEYAT